MATALSVAMAPLALAENIASDGPLAGYTYFTHPGASIEEHDKDVAGCVADVKNVGGPVSVAPGILGTAMVGVLDTYNKNAFFRTNLEHCMVLRGWQVARVPKPEGEALFGQPPAAIKKQLEQWIGRDPAYGGTQRFLGFNGEKSISAINDGAKSLSLASVADGQAVASRNPEFAIPSPDQKALGPLSVMDGLSQAPEGKAIVVLQFKGSAKDGFNRFVFTKLVRGADATGKGPPQPWFELVPNRLFKGADATSVTLVYAVDPGTWGISSAPGLKTCLLLPVMTLKPGDVVFAGAFDMDRPFGPELGLDRGREVLKQAPELAAKVKAAPWVNGYGWPCQPMIVGGYAISGAPYADTYPWRPLAAYEALHR